jgi:hypothetical protein
MAQVPSKEKLTDFSHLIINEWPMPMQTKKPKNIQREPGKNLFGRTRTCRKLEQVIEKGHGTGCCGQIDVSNPALLS